MFLRTFSAGFLLCLAACGKGTPDPVAEADADDRVQCAVGNGALASDCVIERGEGLYTVRHSDGAFRRFEIDKDGDFGSADGAEDVTGNRLTDGSVDVRIGDAHYRFAPGQL